MSKEPLPTSPDDLTPSEAAPGSAPSSAAPSAGELPLQEHPDVYGLARLGMWEWRGPRLGEGRFWCSADVHRIFGRPPVAATYPEAWLWEMVGTETAERLRAALEGALHSGQSFDLYTTTPAPAGGARHVLVTGSPEPDPEYGLRIYGALRDITQHMVREKILAAQEQRYQLLFDQAADGIFVASADGRLLEVNPSGARLLGLERKALVGRRVDDFLGTSVEELRASLARGDRRGAPVAFVHRIRRADGVPLDVEVNAVRLATGEIQAVVRDITEQRRRALEVEMLATLGETLRPAVHMDDILTPLLSIIGEYFELDGAAVTFMDRVEPVLRVRQGWGDLLALTGETLAAGEGITAYVVATGRAFATADIRSEGPRYAPRLVDPLVAMAGLPLTTHRRTLGALIVGRRQRPGGAKPFTPGELRLLSTIADLTANALRRTVLYDQLEAQAEQMRLVMNTVDEGLVLLDAERRVLLSNPAADAYLALLAADDADGSLESLGGYTLAELAGPPPPGAAAHTLYEPGGGGRIFEGRAQRTTPGHSAGWVLLLREVTEDRRMQELVSRHDRLAAIGQFAAGIAHDFNNILAVILLYSQMLEKAPDTTEAARAKLEIIVRQSRHAAALIQQILDFSRRSVMEMGRFDLLPLFKEWVKLWQRILPDNIQVHMRHAQERYLVDGDPTRLEQALMNLVVNARDAMQPAGGNLELTLEQIAIPAMGPRPVPEMEPGPWLRVSVADTGSGVRAEHIPRFFEPFFTTKAPDKGTGLGLPQVYGIMRQHNGWVEVESRLGVGSTFHLYLPLVPATVEAAGAGGAAEAQPAARAPAHGPRTILLVDDEPETQAAVRAVLESYGYRVLAAADGEAALALAADHADEIDLLVSDLILPRMGGVELARALRRRRPEQRVLFMTGYPLDEEGRASLLEATHWLQKPFTPEALAGHVARALGDPV